MTACDEAKRLEQPSEASVPTFDAREFMGERRIVRLVLDGEVYTLRLTKNDRLILTK